MKLPFSLCLLLAICALPSFADDPKPLERVPKDAALFAHIRVEGVFETAIIKEVLKPLDAKMTKMILASNELEKALGMTLQDVESLTLVIPRVAEQEPVEIGYAIVVTKKPYDKKKLTEKLKRKREEKDKFHFPKNPEAPIKGGCDEKPPVAPKAPAKKKLPDNVLPLEVELGGSDSDFNMVFLGERELILVSDEMLDSVLNLKVKETGPHLASLKKAASKDYLAVIGYHPAAGVEEILDEEIKREIKDFLPAILPSHGEVTLTMKKGIEVEGTWSYPSEEKAADGANSLAKALETFQESFEQELRRTHENIIINMFGKTLLEQVKKVKPKVDGKVVRMGMTFPVDDPTKIGKQIAEDIDYSHPRAVSQNNMKQILVAFHNFESVAEVMPAAAICDKEGKPLLSWRVAILPYIEQEDLYNQFKLDEPWDSKNNKKLIEMMPKTYALPDEERKAGQTRYRVFVGKDSPFDYKKKAISIATIPDGSSNTAAVFESADPVIWTKPDEMEFDLKKTTTKSLYFDKRGKTIVSFFDGSVRLIGKKLLDDNLGKIVGHQDGQIIPDLFGDDYRKGEGDDLPKKPLEEPKKAIPPRRE